MTDRRLWLLPPGIEELLPPAAANVETLRRQVLDVFESWGYELVTPPLVEHHDALSVGAGADLASEVFPLTDQLTGRLLGVRTDMTTQVARIDARLAMAEASRQLSNRTTPGDGTDLPARSQRLAYVGSVLRARAEGSASSRNPVQIGAEVYGHTGLESDFESIALMIESLQCAGIAPLHLDLGHVGVFRALCDDANLDEAQRDGLHAALQRKAVADFDATLAAGRDAGKIERLRALAGLNGAADILATAREQLRGAPGSALEYLEQLAGVADMVAASHPQVQVNVDLAELRGFRYHTGLVFAAFTPGFGREIARGGRYDGIGAAFGVARAATGFSADLRVLASLGSRAAHGTDGHYVLAPAVSTSAPDSALEAEVRALRARGMRVVRQLPGAQPMMLRTYDTLSELVREADGWTTRTLRQ